MIEAESGRERWGVRREDGDASRERRICVLVLGMHGLNMPALAGVFGLLGAALPQRLTDRGERDSSTSSRESDRLKLLHDRMLAEGASRWDDWRAFDPLVLGPERLGYYREEIRRLIREEMGDAPLLVVEDARTYRFVSLYESALAELSVEPRFVLVNGSPRWVIEELAEQDGITAGFAGLLWLRHVLDAEAATRGRPRAFFPFEAFVDDWRGAIERLAAKLDLTSLRRLDEAAGESDVRLVRSLRRHERVSGGVAEGGVVSFWINHVYAALQRLAGDEAESRETLAKLARVRKEFEEAALIFGAATVPEIAVRESKFAAVRRRAVGELERRAEALSAERSGLSEKVLALEHRVEVERDEHDALVKRVVEAERQVEALRDERGAVMERITSHDGRLDALATARSSLAQRLREATVEATALRHQLDYVMRSKSWRLTAPLRAMWRGTRAVRVGNSAKGVVREPDPITVQDDPIYRPPQMTYVPLLAGEALATKPVRLICFYLPQFHPIPENSEWWGEGFTEWTNVRSAKPQFVGHYQPHEPGDLGYYDLRDEAVQRRQVELARLYGIEGFCFYLYWFGGRRLLETPLESYVKDRTLDLPFCLCWANENWTRRWDGFDNEILIGQAHSPADDLAFIDHVARYMREERYIRIGGRPLLVVYRPGLLPSPEATARRWRTWCRKNGVGEIYLAYTQSFDRVDPGDWGFDAAIEFPPHQVAPRSMADRVTPLTDDFACEISDWRVFVERSENYPNVPYRLFRTVCPGWDNTARRGNRAAIFVHSTPQLYGRWLRNAVRDTQARFRDREERLVFVNAWNEWAEGAYLEPNARHGYAFLQSTRDALMTPGASLVAR